MKCRIAKRFARVEAQGVFGAQGTVNDPADPITLMIRVTDAEDVTNVIEEAFTNLPSSGVQDPTNIISQLPVTSYPGVIGQTPFRATTGLWSYDLTAALYQPGKAYSVSWRYEMTPGNLKVDHAPFVWNPPPVKPRDPANCVISDNWADLVGIPESFKHIGLEQYDGSFAVANRRDTLELQTDLFGNWWIEVPRGILLRFVIGERARQIIVPDDFMAVLSAVKEVQPADVNKDRFGYPLP